MKRLLFSLIALAALAGPASAETRRFGVMLDAGVPDGVTGSMVYRPISALQLHAGGGYNLIAPGIRAGVGFRPLPFAVAPSLNIELGRYFEGDANAAARRVGAASSEDPDNPLLREVGYDYANFHLGLDIGRRRASFYLHAGVSAVRGRVRNLEEAAANDQMDPSGPTVEIRDDPRITVWAPSARLGLIIYL